LADEEEALKDDHPPEAPLTTIQTAQLASFFCFLWFIANWSANASLKYTSVGSSTVLASTSGMCHCVPISSFTDVKGAGLFTLVVGRILGVEAFNWQKMTGVIAR